MRFDEHAPRSSALTRALASRVAPQFRAPIRWREQQLAALTMTMNACQVNDESLQPDLPRADMILAGSPISVAVPPDVGGEDLWRQKWIGPGFFELSSDGQRPGRSVRTSRYMSSNPTPQRSQGRASPASTHGCASSLLSRPYCEYCEHPSGARSKPHHHTLKARLY